MANGTEEQHRHFILDGVTEVESYRSPRQGGKRPWIPEWNRQRHGAALQRQLDALRPQAEAARNAQQQAGLDEGLGLLVEFESFPGIELAFESLARERSGIELLNVRSNAGRTRATVFVPDGKLVHFENLINDYLAEKRDSIGRARDNKRLLNAIREIRAASLRALWTDDGAVLPTVGDGAIWWWEVWLPVRQNRGETVDAFRTLVAAQGMRVAPGTVDFPERTVLLVSASVEQMQRSMLTLNSIAELRRPKETAKFFDSIEPVEQHEWLKDLRGRTSFVNNADEVTYVCVLDTGVTRDHPLLKNALDTADLHTVEPAWLVGDDDGHGTSMAGLAIFGDLTDLLSGRDNVNIEHRLESVKLLRTSTNGGNPRHHGYLTEQAVARPEVTALHRSRVFSMAVTARDNRDRGRPSAWSATLDSLAAASAGHGANPRLLVVSAGNSDNAVWSDYPEGNEIEGVHDPAQAWNVLTVGAYTNLVQITEDDADGYYPVAPRGGLSPFSTTSLTWERRWPLKPDVVLEGGNAAKDAFSAVWMRSLSLLTTHHRLNERMFTTANATSAATALASRLAAQVMAAYPDLWPETIRALIVQSAEWTDAMKRSFLPVRKVPSKADYRRLVQRCGFGVPSLDRALWSVANSLTMVVQERLHPFKREIGKHATLRDMHVHRLPWPQDVLENLGDTPVTMRVTLSYFIEPNPSRRGDRSRYRYESHGLRFDVKRPAESIQDFRTRINAAARDDEAGMTRGGDDPNWTIGKQSRHRGSLHSDIWRGSAAELASRAVMAVYPTLGWWKSRPGLKRDERAARYALVVSITAPEVDVDLYTAVANKIQAPVAVGR